MPPRTQSVGDPNLLDTPSDVSPIIINNGVQAPEGQYFTAEQVEAIRRQEKDKLYADQERLRSQVDSFRTQLDELAADKTAREAAEAQRQAELTEAQRIAAEAEMTAQQRIESRMAELAAEQESTRRELALQQAVNQREREFIQLESYKNSRLAELTASDAIMPELVEYIGGTTQAEIDASINTAVAKTAKIIEGMQGTPGQQPITAPVPPGVSPTGFVPSGPLDTYQGSREFTAADVDSMDMATYAANRARLGVAGAGGNNGMFK